MANETSLLDLIAQLKAGGLGVDERLDLHTDILKKLLDLTTPYTELGASFAQVATGTEVSVTLDVTSWCVVGQFIVISDDTGASLVLSQGKIKNVVDATTIILEIDDNHPDWSPIGTIIPENAKVGIIGAP